MMYIYLDNNRVEIELTYREKYIGDFYVTLDWVIMIFKWNLKKNCTAQRLRSNVSNISSNIKMKIKIV